MEEKYLCTYCFIFDIVWKLTEVIKVHYTCLVKIKHEGTFFIGLLLTLPCSYSKVDRD